MMQNYSIELDKFYDEIERVCTYDFYMGRNIKQLLVDIRDKPGDIERSKKAQCEINCFSFIISNGELKPLFQQYNKETKEILEIPDIKLFTNEDYNYLKHRIKETRNPNIISRYATIIWNGKRDYIYARVAIDNYLIVIKDIKSRIDKNVSLIQFIEYIINAYSLSMRISGYKYDEIKQLILEIVKNNDLNQSRYNILKYCLINLMISEKKNFNKVDLQNIDFQCWELAINANKTEDTQFIFDLIELGKKSENILKTNKYDWVGLEARTYEKLARGNDNTLKLSLLKKAIMLYKQLNCIDKVNELTNCFNESKANLNLNVIKFESEDLFEIICMVQKEAKLLSQESSELILNHLISNNELLLGSNVHFEELANQFEKDFPLIFNASKTIFDEHNNIISKYETKEELHQISVTMNYKLYIEHVVSQYLNCLLIFSIKNQKLSSDIIFDFLKNETWIGETFHKDEHVSYYDHLFYLLPILNQYFYEFNIYVLHPNYEPHFVLTIDSLILKLEGMIRTICGILGINTTRITNEGSEEKTLNALLDDEYFKEFIGEDDLLFLKFLLVDKAGLNLRNKVAHSLMTVNDYNLNNVNLLILALFRLVKYEFM